jgi:hypothetical protein
MPHSLGREKWSSVRDSNPAVTLIWGFRALIRRARTPVLRTSCGLPERIRTSDAAHRRRCCVHHQAD